MNFEFRLEQVSVQIIASLPSSKFRTFGGVAKQKRGDQFLAGFDQENFSDGSQLILELVVPLKKSCPNFQYCNAGGRDLFCQVTSKNGASKSDVRSVHYDVVSD